MLAGWSNGDGGMMTDGGRSRAAEAGSRCDGDATADKITDSTADKTIDKAIDKIKEKIAGPSGCGKPPS